MNGKDDIRTDVEQNENGFCTLQVRTKRGEGTRDEDRITATLGRDSLKEIEEQRSAMISMVRETVEDVRDIQADEGDENDE